MPSLTREAVYRSLKRGEVAPVYYLTGDETVLKDELVDEIVAAAVEPAARDFNVDIRSAGDLDGEALYALVETPPMLAARRAVVVKGLEQWRSGAAVWRVLTRYLAHPSSSTVLVLVHGAGEAATPTVSAASRHVQMDTLPRDLAAEWAVTRARQAGIVLQPEAATHLVTVLGDGLAHVGMEIEKLAAACPPGRPVGLDDVARMVGVRSGETVPDWVDAVLARDTRRSIQLLGVVLPQPEVSGVRLLMTLGTALVGSRFARALMDGGATPRAAEASLFNHLRTTRPPRIGVWKDETQRWVRTAQAWTAGELDEALRALHATDRALKVTGISDEQAVLTGLLLQIAPQRAAA